MKYRMKYSILTIVVSTLILTSCGAPGNMENEDLNQITIQMQAEGFQEGVVMYSEQNGDCAYTIKTDGDTSEYLDPLTLDEGYKVDGQKVWIKFKSLRMKNRCEKARPIEIIDIKPRK